jgi:hypothetical protein
MSPPKAEASDLALLDAFEDTSNVRALLSGIHPMARNGHLDPYHATVALEIESRTDPFHDVSVARRRILHHPMDFPEQQWA